MSKQLWTLTFEGNPTLNYGCPYSTPDDITGERICIVRHNRPCPGLGIKGCPAVPDPEPGKVEPEGGEGCLCQGCGKRYKVDFLIPDKWWIRIRPADKPEEGGLLCGHCIIDRLERMGYGAFHVAALPPAPKEDGK